MVFGVFGVEGGDVELLHEADHLRAREVAEGVAGEAEAGSGEGLRRSAGFWVCARGAERSAASSEHG